MALLWLSFFCHVQGEFVTSGTGEPRLFGWAVMAAEGKCEVCVTRFSYQHITMHPFEEERRKTKTACLGGSLRETCA